MRILILLVLIVPIFAASYEERMAQKDVDKAASTWTKKMKAAEEAYNKAVKAATDDYNKSVEKALARLKLTDTEHKLIEAMTNVKDEKVIEALPAKVKLAMKIKKNMKSANLISEAAGEGAIEPKAKTKVNETKSTKEILKFIVTNKWKYNAWMYVFKEDGTVEEYNSGKITSNVRKWRVDGKNIVLQGRDNQTWTLQGKTHCTTVRNGVPWVNWSLVSD